MIVTPQISKAYREFRQSLLATASIEKQFKEDANFFDATARQNPSSFNITYTEQAIEGLVKSFDKSIQALESFRSLIPGDVLDNQRILEKDISRAVTQESEALKAAVEQISRSGGASSWFLELYKALTKRRDAFQLGTYLLTAEGAKLSDVFRVRNALDRSSSISPLDQLTTPEDIPEPQPFILLCAFGPPGARVVCMVGLAIAIAASNHNVE